MARDTVVDELISDLLAADSDIRYVAVRQGGSLTMQEKSGVAGASAPESDRYEELLVNPTLLTLLTQRGDIDCGGLDFVLIRYGNFFQFVYPVAGGHVSIALEPGSRPHEIIPRLRSLVDHHFGRP